MLVNFLNDARKLVNSSLIDAATNGRTGQTTPCRVSTPTVRERLEGAPSMMRIWGWPIVLPDATPVMPGDQLVIPGKGTYQTILVESPTTYSAATNILAAQTINATGTPVSPLLTNQTITLTNPTGTPGQNTLTLGAYVAPRSPDLLVRPDEAGYDYMAIWAGDPLYPDTKKIRSGHHIDWPGLEAAPSQKVPITQPRRYYSPIPYCVALFMGPA